jgi:hypothetical protein
MLQIATGFSRPTAEFAPEPERNHPPPATGGFLHEFRRAHMRVIHISSNLSQTIMRTGCNAKKDNIFCLAEIQMRIEKFIGGIDFFRTAIVFGLTMSVPGNFLSLALPGSASILLSYSLLPLCPQNTISN